MINIAELIENRKIKIGFIGLGAMGSRMANNLINKSFNLLVFDLDSNKMDVLIDKGATGFNSIKEIAENSDLIITSLPSSKEIEAVVLADDGLLNFMKSGSVFVDVSTALPSSTTKLSQMFADKNIEMLDAPV